MSTPARLFALALTFVAVLMATGGAAPARPAWGAAALTHPDGRAALAQGGSSPDALAQGGTASGAPLAFAYLESLGTAGVPFGRSAAFLSQPAGLANDDEGVWVAEAAGRRVLRLGANQLTEIGRAGSSYALPGVVLRRLADVDYRYVDAPVPTATPTPRGGPTATPDRSGATPTPGPQLVDVWVADEGAHTVVRVVASPSGGVRSAFVLGQADTPGTDDKHLSSPGGVAIDPRGFVYVSDSGNQRVQIFDASGSVVSAASVNPSAVGTLGETGQAGADDAHFNHPARLAVGADDKRLYVVDTGNHRVQVFDTSDPRRPRKIQTYGRSGQPGAADDQFDSPTGIAVHGQLVYVADTANHRVQVLSKIAGKHFLTLDPENCGLGSTPGGPGTTEAPSDVAVSRILGSVQIALPDQMRVQTCTPGVTGNYDPNGSFGQTDQPYLTEDGLYNTPSGIAMLPDGGWAVAERDGHRVVRIAPDGSLQWTFGRAGVPGADDTHLNGPLDLAVDPSGRIYVADTGNSRLIVLEADGNLAAAWGDPSATAPPAPGGIDTRLLHPEGITVLKDGRIAVADTGHRRVIVFNTQGQPDRVLDASSGAGWQLVLPSDVAEDASGQWAVADRGAHVVRRFDDQQKSLGVLGVEGVPGDAFDHFNKPQAVVFTAEGLLAVADTANQRVEVFDGAGGFVTTIGGRADAGTGGLREPMGLAAGSAGASGGGSALGSRLAVADTANHRIQVFTLAGDPWRPENVNGFGERGSLEVSALASFGGELYAGSRGSTLGAGGTGAAAAGGAGAVTATAGGLWHLGDDGSWQRVADPVVAKSDTVVVNQLTSYGGQLYAATERVTVTGLTSGPLFDSRQGAGLYRSGDGASGWEAVTADGFGSRENVGIGALAEYGGFLWAGTRTLTDTQPAQIWRSASGAAGTWERLRFESPGNTWTRERSEVSAMGVYSNSLYVATCTSAGVSNQLPYLWRTRDGAKWEPSGSAVPDGDKLAFQPMIDAAGACVTSLSAFDGWFYAALAGRPAVAHPVEIMRCQQCDGQDWEPAASPGLSGPDNRGRAALMPFSEPPFNYLYLAMGNPVTGLEVWRAPDGLNWEAVAVGGFGDDNNVELAGQPAVAVHGRRLFVGTMNDAHGGELWSTGGTRPGQGNTPNLPTPTPLPKRPAPKGPAPYRQVNQWPLAPAVPGNVLAGDVDMAVADDGDVYILDGTYRRVLHLRANGTWAEAFGATGTGPERLGQVGAVGVDGPPGTAGRVFVSDLSSDRLVIFDRDGKFVLAVPDSHAWGIYVRPDHTVWLADRMIGGVRRIRADGTEIERFGSYGPDGDTQFTELQSVVEDPNGRLFVADYLHPTPGGVPAQRTARIRAFERFGNTFRRVRTIWYDAPQWRPCNPLRRLQMAGVDTVLAGRCVIQDGMIADMLPANQAGSDIYGVQLQTMNLAAGRFVALATYDGNNQDPRDPTYPVVVNYFDPQFRNVSRTIRGLVNPPNAGAAGVVAQAVRLSVAPDGTIVLGDAFGVRRFTPNGDLVFQHAITTCASYYPNFGLAPALTIGYGDEEAGVGQPLTATNRFNGWVVARGQTKNINCRGGTRALDRVIAPIWRTTLNGLYTANNLAVAHEPTRNRLVLLNNRRDNPSPIEDLPYQLLLYGLGDYGRKDTVDLEGGERLALWTDVEANADGRIVALDSLSNYASMFDASGNHIRNVLVPKDAWRVAMGPNDEVFVLTVRGQVVRLAPDGTELSRFVGLAAAGAPPVEMVDLAVDSSGRVYTVDTFMNRVTVFEPDLGGGSALQGATCQVSGQKWVTPPDILIGNTADLHLTLGGQCGAVETPADIVIAVNTFGSNRGQQLMNNLRVARQILSLIDTDRHRVGIVAFSASGEIESPLTHDALALIRALTALAAGRVAQGDAYAALEIGGDMLLADSPERQKVLVILDVDTTSLPALDRANQIKAKGVRVLSVNSPSDAATNDLLSDIPVPPRGIGTGRPALRRMILATKPQNLVATGVLTDRLPANIDYVVGSANPPAQYDPATRTLTWQVAGVPLTATFHATLTIRPREEGLWPTNVEAIASVTDGYSHPGQFTLPVPKIRVYGAPPPTSTPRPTRTATPTRTPIPTITPTPLPSATPTATRIPEPIFLPLAINQKPCSVDTRHADVVLVIDTSGSMSETTRPDGPTKLEAARLAAKDFVAQLAPGRDRAGLVQFNSEVTVIVPLGDDLAAVTAGLDQLTQGPGTRIDLALDAARAELAGPAHKAGNNPVLVLLTDGHPSGTTPDEVRAAAARALAAGLLVFTIGLGTDLDEQLLRDIASQPAWYFHAADTGELAAIYAQIAYTIPCRMEWP